MITFNQYRMPIAALLLLAFGQQANASPCGAMSPRLLELGNQYYVPTPVPHAPGVATLEGPLLSTLEQLLGDSFHGGNGIRVTCLGTGDQARSVTSHFELREIQKRTLLNGENLLTALEEVHNRVTESADDRLPDSNSSHPIKLSLPPAAVWRVDASGQALSSVTTHRRRNALKLTLLHERVWLATPSATGVDLQMHDYINGIHGGSMLWRLSNS